MNALAWLNPGRWLLMVGIVAAVAIGAPILKARYDANQQRIGYERAHAEYAESVRIQRERNLELQRAAEKRYTVQAGVREEFITQTIKEVRYVTQTMASCPVPDAARRLFNDAAACAREDRPAACGAGEPVPAAR